jgi:hypothetical protein
MIPHSGKEIRGERKKREKREKRKEQEREESLSKS